MLSTTTAGKSAPPGRQKGRGPTGPPRPIAVYRALAPVGLHRSAIALQVAHMVAWHLLANGATRNACTVPSYLSPRWLARELDVDRRSCITAVKRLLASGSLVVLAQTAGRRDDGRPARRVRMLLHLLPACVGSGIAHLDEDGVCQWCGASLLAADDSRYPLGLVGWRSLVTSTGGGDLEITPPVIPGSGGGDLEITPPVIPGSPPHLYVLNGGRNGETTKEPNVAPAAPAGPASRNAELVLREPPARRRKPRRATNAAPAISKFDHLVQR